MKKPIYNPLQMGDIAHATKYTIKLKRYLHQREQSVAFLEAAFSGDIARLKRLLLELNVNLKICDGEKRTTALWQAVYGTQVEVVKFLLNNGAKVEKNLLSISLDDFCEEQKQIAELLLNNGYTVTDYDIKEYLMQPDNEITEFFEKKFHVVLQDIRDRGGKI